MVKLLIGGSPCTHWSIAQTKNRETKPEGLGWELFENYKIALDKFKPDYFLYENNKSMSSAIRKQITAELGLEPILINSALLSAQIRERLYWTNIPGVTQPEDKGILLRDILETGVTVIEEVPPMRVPKATKQGYIDILPGECVDLSMEHSKTRRGRRMAEKSNCLTTSSALYEYCGTIDKPIYRVEGGYITINDEKYPIKLRDDYYIIRKLTVLECMRLQTVPEDYVFPVSPTQAYKMLGNGWTVDVIAHILSYCPGITEEPLEVLSMYDGMSCGRLALNKLGAHIAHYYATEIDKYAINTTQHNFPDTIQLGDAFQVRSNNFWSKFGFATVAWICPAAKKAVKKWRKIWND